MWNMQCPYCPGVQARCTRSSSSGRWLSECCSCGRVVEERQIHPHDLFLLRAQDKPLCLVTPDLNTSSFSSSSSFQQPPFAPAAATKDKQGQEQEEEEEDPFEPTGFITAFSTWSLENTPLYALSSHSFSGHLAELERALDISSSSSSSSTAATSNSSSNPNPNPSSNSNSTANAAASGPTVVVDNLRAYLQIIDVASILGLDHDISDHAFQLFRDCSSATCLRNRSVEALATAALVQAIREAQEPRTLQEISTAANLPQKEIGKYIKILGEALKLSQPINSNSISVHMPRFCTLLQLNKSAQSLATHIGEVVINKCFCTRRNPISISAAAIYLACQLEDKRKTQAEICKVTGLTEVTLRKVYKELLENWDDLLPPNYTPAVPPEKAFPTTTIASSRPSSTKVETVEIASSSAQLDKEKQPEAVKPSRTSEISETEHQARGKEEAISKSNFCGPSVAPSRVSSTVPRVFNQGAFWQPQLLFGLPSFRPEGDKNRKPNRGIDINEALSNASDFQQKDDRDKNDTTQDAAELLAPSPPNANSDLWQFHLVSQPPYVQFMQPQMVSTFAAGHQRIGNSSKGETSDPSAETNK
ncbi:plant-specific TFIIB-related protein 1-like protein [Cinnamomum micranthum f. kanehirae]|uniref:Plant-specific TFIIB-related protein 1-like protein n=1 Tax=Cinnamomum micranthum f. kanehirae TaxID=337451 RepID=A0A443N6Y9_9MAGN|nr:plant-specific TFIIB-related protein 1-like protein [Cinnamomum micranthum f. kanehirae]